jgi:hypothetical protein
VPRFNIRKAGNFAKLVILAPDYGTKNEMKMQHGPMLRTFYEPAGEPKHLFDAVSGATHSFTRWGNVNA